MTTSRVVETVTLGQARALLRAMAREQSLLLLSACPADPCSAPRSRRRT
jgi:hypothetical protein